MIPFQIHHQGHEVLKRPQNIPNYIHWSILKQKQKPYFKHRTVTDFINAVLSWFLQRPIFIEGFFFKEEPDFIAIFQEVFVPILQPIYSKVTIYSALSFVVKSVCTIGHRTYLFARFGGED
jgi:hypothetical protein